MKTSATNKRVRELINLVKDGKLIPRPEFQRRLVWAQKDKERFLDTVLRQLPFPEIYLADGDVDLETGAGTQLLVDGLQRVSTLVQYFEGDASLKLMQLPPYQQLKEEEKRDFLQYEIAIRDLGTASRELLIDVFKRINATKYSLNDIEIHNALYAGALKQYAELVASHPFFDDHDVFTQSDYKRMGDLRFTLSIIISMLGGYFNRDDAFEEYLQKFNDDFPFKEEVEERVNKAIAFIDECGFEPQLRIWKKADLLTVLVEVDRHFQGAVDAAAPQLEPGAVVDALTAFYDTVDQSGKDLAGSLQAVYYKAALQASNDRANRVRRGMIIEGLLRGEDPDVTLSRLTAGGFV